MKSLSDVLLKDNGGEALAGSAKVGALSPNDSAENTESLMCKSRKAVGALLSATDDSTVLGKASFH